MLCNLHKVLQRFLCNLSILTNSLRLGRARSEQAYVRACCIVVYYMSDYTTNYTRGYLVGRKKFFIDKTLCSGKKNTKPIFDFLERKSTSFLISNFGKNFLTLPKKNGISKLEVVK